MTKLVRVEDLAKRVRTLIKIPRRHSGSLFDQCVPSFQYRAHTESTKTSCALQT